MKPINTNVFPDLYPDLNIADIDIVEGAAGPGRRLIIWLQGCLKRCPGCANGLFLPIEKIQRVYSVDQVITLIDSLKGLNGITLSGGEPVLQAKALLPLLEAAWQRDLTVVSYSGYAYKELTANYQDQYMVSFLGHVDLLIDGEYVREEPRGGIYRPSQNQRLHFLSGRIPEQIDTKTPETVFTFNGSDAVHATGTLPLDIRKALFEGLREAGIDLKALN